MSYSAVEEAKRCLRCKVPKCRGGCPIKTDIPRVVELFLNGGIDEAGRILFDNNPLSLVCALVCNHGQQCRGNCVLGNKGQPVGFPVIESYISERYLDSARPAAHEGGRKVAVVGAGPAGMTISIKLAQRGYDVTLIESKPRIGGVLRYGIPAFRLPKQLLDKYERLMRGLGIKIKPNVTIGKPYGVDELFADGFEAVSIGTGVAWPNNLGVRGETLAHVHYGVHYLLSPDSYNIGDNVTVIGGGNVAMDAARTALRQGARNVSVVVRGDKLSANPEEAEMAEVDGAQFMYGLAVDEITDDGVRLSGVGGQRFLPSDSVIICIGQKASKFILTQTEGLLTNERGLAVVDENGTTGRPGLYASGDVTKGAKTVVAAVDASKRVADAIDKYLSSK